MERTAMTKKYKQPELSDFPRGEILVMFLPIVVEDERTDAIFFKTNEDPVVKNQARHEWQTAASKFSSAVEELAESKGFACKVSSSPSSENERDTLFKINYWSDTLEIHTLILSTKNPLEIEEIKP